MDRYRRLRKTRGKIDLVNTGRQGERCGYLQRTKEDKEKDENIKGEPRKRKIGIPRGNQGRQEER